MHTHQSGKVLTKRVARCMRYTLHRDSRHHIGTSEIGKPSRHEELWRKSSPTIAVATYVDTIGGGARYTGHKIIMRRFK